STLSSTGGAILINAVAQSGQIKIDSDVTLNSTVAGFDAGFALGGVNMVVGAVPAAPSNATIPTNVSVSNTADGVYGFGTNSITANLSSAAQGNQIIINGVTQVMFSTGTASANAISLG